MAFCSSCGKQVTGTFCANCGSQVGAASSAAPPATAVAAPPGKGISPIVWILGIIAGIFVLGMLVLIGGGLFVAHKVKQAGFDPALWQKNPGVAAAKMIAATNPDVSVVSVNEREGVITLKDKKPGPNAPEVFEDDPHGIAFSRDGKALATSGYGGWLKVWDLNTGKTTYSQKLKTFGAYCVTFTPDGKAVVTGHDNKSIHVTPIGK